MKPRSSRTHLMEEAGLDQRRKTGTNGRHAIPVEFTVSVPRAPKRMPPSQWRLAKTLELGAALLERSSDAWSGINSLVGTTTLGAHPREAARRAVERLVPRRVMRAVSRGEVTAVRHNG